MEKITIDGVTFTLDTRPGSMRGKSKENNFTLVKSAQFLDFYDSLKAYEPKEIMEVGMFEGGSLVYFDKLFQPKTLVGLDIRKDPIAPLEQYVKVNSHVKTYYARSQDKHGTLMSARENFPKGIDLIVDDASHLYAQTKATFEMLFPMLRAGGHYVIEDWSWSHQTHYQDKKHTWFQQPALTNLVFELVVLAGKYGVIDSIHIDKNLLSIKKGKGFLPQNALELEGCLRDRSMSQI
jgi:predicted O-methyltransferase YrrM